MPQVEFKFKLGDRVFCPDGKRGKITGMCAFLSAPEQKSYSVRPDNFKGTNYRYWAEEDLKSA